MTKAILPPAHEHRYKENLVNATEEVTALAWIFHRICVPESSSIAPAPIYRGGRCRTFWGR
jgi:hypothetical protein